MYLGERQAGAQIRQGRSGLWLPGQNLSVKERNKGPFWVNGKNLQCAECGELTVGEKAGEAFYAFFRFPVDFSSTEGSIWDGSWQNCCLAQCFLVYLFHNTHTTHHVCKTEVGTEFLFDSIL